jgi:2-succinyl-6-hydroxy-2,4-cyclohexadiene-1-carboxylate synthase
MSWLMLHGFTGSRASFLRLAMPGAVALAPTLGGHLGEPASADFWAEVDRLAALAPHAREIFGYSLGARLALGLIARYPRRFERAVLVSAHPGLRTDAERALRRAHDERFVRVLREHGLVKFVSAWEKQSLWRTQRTLPDAVRAARHRERLTHTAEGLARSLSSVGLGHMPDLRAPLARTGCPVEFLAGAKDTKFVALAQELCRIVPHARLNVAGNAGHDLVLERPQFCSTVLSKGLST